MVVFRHLVFSVEFHNYWIIIPAGALENASAAQSGRISPSNTKNIKTVTTYIRMWIIMIMQCICNSASEPSGLFLQEPHDLLFMLLQNISCGHFLPLVKNRHEKLIRKKQYQLKHDTVGNMIRQTTSNVPDYSKLLSLTNTDMAHPIIFLPLSRRRKLMLTCLCSQPSLSSSCFWNKTKQTNHMARLQWNITRVQNLVSGSFSPIQWKLWSFFFLNETK